MNLRLNALALTACFALTACGGSEGEVQQTSALSPEQQTAGQGQPPGQVHNKTRATLGSRGTESRLVPVETSGNTEWQSYDREALYSDTVSLGNFSITMSDGVRLLAKVVVPGVDANTPAAGPFPVILTQTSYNSSVGQFVPAIGGASEYLIKRGYASVVVDVRGTGNSEGNWEAFGEREQQDYGEVVDWIVEQPWSNGRVGLQGISYLGITAILTAQQQHPAVKAAFPIVPIGDGYRDIVFTGGNVNATFIPLWMGAVTGLGILPLEQLSTMGVGAFVGSIPDRLEGLILDFQVPTILNALLGEKETVFDEGFWDIRSPIEGAEKINVPTFIVGGLNDIFQRSEPLWYERLKGQVPVKLLIGPWTHIEAAGLPSDGLPADGVPEINKLQLQWFDQYVMGLNTRVENQPNVTQYVTGLERYETTTDWPHPDMQAERFYLNAGGAFTQGQLVGSVPAEETTVSTLQQPLNGLCSFSTTQWTIGATGFIPLPCFESNDASELASLKFEMPAGEDGLYLNGPMMADLWVSSTARDVQLSVRIDLVAPSGVSEPISNGLMTASMQSIDESRSRYDNGIMLQPWHTFRAGDREMLTPLEPKKVSVEIFPSSAYVPPGSSLRVSVSTSNAPQGLPPLLQLLDSVLGVMTLHMGPDTPSSITLPVVPSGAIAQ
ncbi:MAG: CocE/NonD family hydrolase [Gammaproteobacteria bacterium]|nr:MAG: CocE/NonD family hydrolase [Gammaproteobacteria bacterium]